jgi:hypothetical protein
MQGSSLGGPDIGGRLGWGQTATRREARDEAVDMCFLQTVLSFETNKTEFHQRTQTSYKRAPRVHGPGYR